MAACRGSCALRIHYRNLVDRWFDYLIVSPDEMEQIITGTGWRIRRLVRDESPYYVAVLE